MVATGMDRDVGAREVIYIGWPGYPSTGTVRLLVDSEGHVLKNLDEEAIANAVPGVKP